MTTNEIAELVVTLRAAGKRYQHALATKMRIPQEQTVLSNILINNFDKIIEGLEAAGTAVSPDLDSVMEEMDELDKTIETRNAEIAELKNRIAVMETWPLAASSDASPDDEDELPLDAADVAVPKPKRKGAVKQNVK